ncbi:hypothetical protein ABW20_dc0103480 [Dactylellina cionopaga]|nr:hypothetical protein ABW20_dc0103480 [Dactylellina cionopaga]
MSISSLPTEIHEQILHHLPWHDHFLAAEVCPLWLSILRTKPFRRKRHFEGPRPWTCETPYDEVRSLIFHRQTPKSLGPNPQEPCLHGLLGKRTLEVSMKRGEDSRIVMAIPELNGPAVETKFRKGPQFTALSDKGLTKYDITRCPLLRSDTVAFEMTEDTEYPVFDDNRVHVPTRLNGYRYRVVAYEIPLKYPKRLGGEKPQSVIGMVHDVTDYINSCFDSVNNIESVRAIFMGLDTNWFTDEVRFEYKYGLPKH